MPRGVLTYIFHSSKFQKWIFGTLVCFGRALTQISWIGPIMSYLWMMRLFSCGANHPQVFSQRRSSPLDSVFDTCGSASSSHCFNVGETEHSYLFAFAKAHAFSAKKRMYCNLDARWHMFLQFVPDVWPMQIQNYNHDSTISKKKHPGSQPFGSCGEPYRLKQSWVIFFLGFDVRICSSELTPHGNYFPVARHLHTKGK